MIGRSPCPRIRLPDTTPVRRHIVNGDELGRLAGAMGGVEGYGMPVALVEMVGTRMTARGVTPTTMTRCCSPLPMAGCCATPTGLRRVWYPATVAAGLGAFVTDEAGGRTRYIGLGFHDLRRANATGLVAEGVDIKTAQALLGHSNADARRLHPGSRQPRGGGR